MDVSELTQKLTLAQQKNEANAEQRRKGETLQAAIGTAEFDLDAAQLEVVDAKNEITRLEQELAKARTAVTTAEGVVTTKQQAVEKAKTESQAAHVAIAVLVDVDTQAITEAINSAAAVNSKVQANKSHTDQNGIVLAKKAKADELTAKIDKIDAAKAKLLSDCKFPLEGLAIDGDEILFNRLPFAQASTAQKLRVSCSIGMSLSPDLRVMFIRDGSLLDAEGLKSIAELAEKNSYQIWVEDARSTDPMALVIEDGEIVKP